MIVPMRPNRRRIFGTSLLIFLLAACELQKAVPAATSTPEPASTSKTTETPVPTPKPELGEPSNPILLALPPTQFPDPVVIANGQSLATLIEEKTDYRVVAVAPTTYTELIEALKTGNAHIAVLPIFAIAQAYHENAVQAAFASTQEEAASYGAQFVARSDRFTAYFNTSDGINTVTAPEALTQFSGKKPCWTAQDSPSGYLVPAGILNWYKIPTQEGAFLQSHFSVVRAVRSGEICDFGATYIDARTYPALKEGYPFIMDEVVVVWQVPPIIPYDGIFLSPTLPAKTQIRLKKALDLIFATDNGKLLFESLFGIQGIIEVEDIFYVEFTRYIQSSGIDITNLVH
jgi:ABC-type phosphate/phosphonate transport system substrate-binding protein